MKQPTWHSQDCAAVQTDGIDKCTCTFDNHPDTLKQMSEQSDKNYLVFPDDHLFEDGTY